MEMVFRALLAVFYDGTNADDCLACVREITANDAQWTIRRENERRVVLEESQGEAVAEWPVRRDHWLVVAPDFGVIARISDREFKKNYRRLPDIQADPPVDPPVDPTGQPTPGPVHGP